MTSIAELSLQIELSLAEKNWSVLAELDNQLRQILAAELDRVDSPEDLRVSLVHLQGLYRQLCAQAESERNALKTQVNNVQAGRKAAQSYGSAGRY